LQLKAKWTTLQEDGMPVRKLDESAMDETLHICACKRRDNRINVRKEDCDGPFKRTERFKVRLIFAVEAGPDSGR
jgi:hypothetical protein